MKFNDYQQFAVSLASPASDLAAGVIGLCDEAIELFDETGSGATSRESIVKEGSDVLWYVSYTAHLLGVPLADLLRSDIPQDVYNRATEPWGDTTTLTSSIPYLRDKLVIMSGKVAGQVKKLLYHGHAKEDPSWSLYCVVEALCQLIAAYGITLDEVIDANVRKLTARYGAKFSVQKSLERAE